MISPGEMIDYMRARRSGAPTSGGEELEQVNRALREQIEGMERYAFSQQCVMEEHMDAIIAQIAAFDPLAPTYQQMSDLESRVTEYQFLQQELLRAGKGVEEELHAQHRISEALRTTLVRLQDQLKRRPPPLEVAHVSQGGANICKWVSQSMRGKK